MYRKEELQSKGFHNINAITGRFYLGLGNQMNLKALGYKTPQRITFYQAKLNGLKIKKGAKATPIYYQAVVSEDEFVDGELVEKDTIYKRVHKVFNIEETEPALSTNHA